MVTPLLDPRKALGKESLIVFDDVEPGLEPAPTDQDPL